MKEAKHTPWFPIKVRPVRDGVYQVDGVNKRQPYNPMYSEYRNGVWLGTSSNLEQAATFGRSFGATTMDLREWRGLAKEPK